MSEETDYDAFPYPIHVNINPQSDYTGDITCAGGMSLRDWFAAMALQGILKRCGCAEDRILVAETAFDYSRAAYQIADAMMEQRRK